LLRNADGVSKILKRAALDAIDPELRIVAPRRSVWGHISDIWRSRELLVRLTFKELTVRYKKSTLGFLWSTLNPLVMLGVYSVAFGILGLSFDDFPIWLITGLLIWNLFSASLVSGTASITSNSYLVGKVRFPREILPLSAVGAALIHFVLQAAMVAIVLLVAGHRIDLSFVWLLPLALLTLIVICSGFAIVLSALNVYARDTAHLLDLTMLALFWLTPISYPFMTIASKLVSKGLPAWLPWINPITPVLATFQRAIYGKASIRAVGKADQQLLPDHSSLWYGRNLLGALAMATVFLYLAIRWFDRVEGNFAEVV
jgi:ABC-2 type transport system permease protein